MKKIYEKASEIRLRASLPIELWYNGRRNVFYQNTGATVQDKEKVYFAVCSAILKLEIEKGHLKWSITDISKVSEITRSLIYYYFGKEKDVILKEAYRFIFEVFFTPPMNTRTGSVTTRMKQTLIDLGYMPYLFVLYYLQKNTDSEVGQMLRKAETQLLAYLENLLPHLSKTQVLELYLKELGAIAYHLSPEQVDEIFGKYQKNS